MQKLRSPAVAGLFYSDDQHVLQKNVDAMLMQAKQLQTLHYKPKAIITPHAGYIYSGEIAASAYSHIIPSADKVRQVLLLGPSHRVALKGSAAPSSDGFSTPLGRVSINQPFIKKLIDSKYVEVDDLAHEQEHSLEVQLPFLQTILQHFQLTPVVVGDADAESVANIIEFFCAEFGDEALIVVSSDLSHFLDYSSAMKRDKTTSDAIEKKNYHLIGPHDACGCTPIAGLLYWTKQHQLSVTTIDLRNSGDTAGTRDRVVGYGAYIIE